MTFAIITAERTRDFHFVMHVAGCRDIDRDKQRYEGYVEEAHGKNAKEAAQAWLDAHGYSDPDVYSSPWKLEHVKILPCCRTGSTKS